MKQLFSVRDAHKRLLIILQLVNRFHLFILTHLVDVITFKTTNHDVSNLCNNNKNELVCQQKVMTLWLQELWSGLSNGAT